MAVFNSLDMFTVEHELAVVLEYFLAGTIEAGFIIFGRFIQICFDRINGIADENRFDEAQFIIAIAECIDAISGDESESKATNLRSGDDAVFVIPVFCIPDQDFFVYSEVWVWIFHRLNVALIVVLSCPMEGAPLGDL